jgi:hypothetical protein
MHIVALRENEVVDHITEGLSFLMCAEASTALVVDFTVHTKDFTRPQRQSTVLRSGESGGQATGPCRPIQWL